LQQSVSITAIASVSPLGNDEDVIWRKYQSSAHCFSENEFNGENALVARLDEDSAEIISKLRTSDPKYKPLDNSVLFAIAASRSAVAKAGWNEDAVFGINIGSSRGATGLFEKHYSEFLESGRANTLSSPTTTLGNISSWVAHDLQASGPEISHSITCSTALHALLNGMAWLRSGMSDKFLVGGSEAPLTAFTIAQMRAMKIYARENDEYPCRATDPNKTQNTMILGEAASVCCLEIGIAENALAIVTGIGYATELLEHSTSISAEADCFRKSMAMALGDIKPEDVDVIVMHAPGTIAGDRSEYKAIENVFGKNLPLLTSNKWKTGHTFGASGMLSIELAVLMIRHQEFIGVPFAGAPSQKTPIKNVLVNAVGFGGNAVSVLLSRP
jgi:3-oxoacyl-(acyl-carrier-protein) synthase